jgi:hypothetical protein
MSASPLAFISHATTDNDRFALPLDAALRARGIRTFFDQRDILVGQNFVDRIFDNGLGTADYVVLILSENTRDSAFVHKELTTAVVGAINGRLKAVLPVLIDGVEAPMALLDVNHVRGSEATVEAVADQLRDAIFGRAEPPVAPPPPYIELPVHRIGRLEADDERVFVFAANLHLDAQRWHPAVSTHDILRVAAMYGMSEAVVLESLEILKHEYFISEEHYEIGTRAPYAVELSSNGLNRFLERYRPRELRRAKRTIISAIVNGENELERIIRVNEITEAFAIAILDELKSAGLLTYEMYSEGTCVTGTAMLKRMLRDLDGEGAT